MPPSLAKIEAEALQLSAEEKVRLADHLLASVSGVDDVWAEEVERSLSWLRGLPTTHMRQARKSRMHSSQSSTALPS